MFEVLSESLLHRFLDEPPPPSIEHLRRRYAELESRASPDGKQLWFNWFICPRGEPVARFVQATLVGGRAAWVGYLLSSKYWGVGYACEAMQAMLAHLAGSHRVLEWHATVEGENRPSIRLLERLAFLEASAKERQGHSLSPTERLFVKRLRFEQNVP